MNYCTKCSSMYTEPGTCNCYATTPVTVPVPLPWFQQTTGQCPYCGGIHFGQSCPQTTIFEITCQPPTTTTFLPDNVCGGTVIIGATDLAEQLADGRSSYTAGSHISA